MSARQFQCIAGSMDVSKYTPGPWTTERIMGNYRIHSQSGVFKNIALVPASLSDARLIGAAPELLEAVDRLLSWSHGGQRAEDVAFARRAYAKALGLEDAQD
ncbi:hypothetical protein [Sinimarinibacterium sp. NLF-5-8]|uniref:hypothetical protein n=1 Tax=Sinimarinibacterium sp. NLF-5-8 TaxID=2698684 RepID=UPI00137C0188|nr:hypothetical protein [Sinimarinibacterium sp. NLF-5-8]QHS09068.1 hypothetical protein GT972_02170 [Sinimarinibacterium sp. NLF-5-8]